MLTASLIWAQQPYFQKLETVNGLASDKVYCVFQDSENYMWFGTDAGASRFDGYAFINFDHQRNFTANEVFDIFEDSQRRIWFLSENGEFSFYKNDSLFTSINTPSFQNLNIQSQITSIWEAPNGLIYISTHAEGIFTVSESLEVNHVFSLELIYKIWGKRDGTLLALGEFGVYDLTSTSVDTLEFYDFSGHYPRSTVFRDTLWIASGDKVFSFYNELELEFKLPRGLESTFIRYHDNKLAIGTRTGSYLNYVPYNTLGEPDLLKESVVSSVKYDNENNLWISTVGDGVYLSTSPEIDIFTTKSGLAVNQVTSLLKTGNSTLWLGYRDGSHGTLDENGFENDPQKTPTNEPVTKIVAKGDGSFWVVSKTYITKIYVDGRKRSMKILGNDLLFENDSVYLASSRAYHLCLADFEKSLGKTQNDINPINPELLESDVLMHRTRVVCQDRSGRVYLGSDRGLFVRQAGKTTSMGTTSNGLNAYIYDIIFDEKRELTYVATRGQGLVVINGTTIINRFDISKNLSSNTCVSLDLDEEGNLWIGTSLGLDRITDVEKDTMVQRYGALIGLRPTTVFDVERVEDDIYMATNIGLMRYHVHKLMLRSPQLPKILSATINSTNVVGANELNFLRYNQNTIRFDFISLSYKNLGNVSYSYNLKGHQDGWRITKDRTIQFEYLEPGEYEFQVKTIDGSGMTSDVVTVPLTIALPFWSTIWFRVMTIVFFGFLVYMFGLWRFKSLKSKLDLEKDLSLKEIERLELEKAYLVSEQKAGVLQMNPHFVFNSLNTIKGYYGQGKLKEANGFIAKFSKLLRKILESNKPLIPIQKEADILSLYLDLMRNRYDHVFDYQIINKVDENKNIMIPPMILQPLVENAVIHGIAPLNQGEIVISFEVTDTDLKCSVTDNGVGFKKTAQDGHHSVALENIQDRLSILSKQYNHTCTIKIVSPVFQDEETPGTSIIINLPINEVQ